MTKPQLFIGSSSEGLQIAEAVFSHLERDTTPTLWTNQLFVPGAYPLDVLETQIKRTTFAVLVASPDDEVIKRGITAPAMRDNLLVEFGLFVGALGRGRVFFVCPTKPRLELPSDLSGLITATYDAERVSGPAHDRSAAVQSACRQIRDVVTTEWAAIQLYERQRLQRIRASLESQAIQRLYTVATRLRDVIFVLQRESFAALMNRDAFEQLKRRTADEVGRIADTFAEDVQTIKVEQEMDQLRSATHCALLDLPFPEELALGRDAITQRTINVGFDALKSFVSGDNPIHDVQSAAEDEARSSLASLGNRYSEWWGKHSPKIQEATMKMNDALFTAMIRTSSERP